MNWEEFEQQAEQVSLEQQQQEKQRGSRIVEYVKNRLLPSLKALLYPEKQDKAEMSPVSDYSIKQKIAVFERSKRLVSMAYDADEIFAEFHALLEAALAPTLSSSSTYSRALAGIVNEVELEELNSTLHHTLTDAASQLIEAEFMQEYLSKAKRNERKRWFLTEQEKAMMSGADSALDIVKQEARRVMKDLALHTERASTPKGGVWISWHMFLVSLAIPVAIGFAGYAMGRMELFYGKVALVISLFLLTLYFSVGLVNFLNNSKH